MTGGPRERGLSELSFSIEYGPSRHGGVVIEEFRSCSMNEISLNGWPASGSSITLKGAAEGPGVGACTKPDPVVVGWFRVTARMKGSLAIRPDFRVGYCGSGSNVTYLHYTDVAMAGSIDFGEVTETSACLQSARFAPKDAAPVELKTWSAVKALRRP